MQDGQGQPADEGERGRDSGYWPRVRHITGALLLVWLLVTILGPWFARDLAKLHWFGFPLSFWVASQGALLVYLAIIIVYAVLMERLERRHDPQASSAAAHGAPPASASAQQEGRDG